MDIDKRIHTDVNIISSYTEKNVSFYILIISLILN